MAVTRASLHACDGLQCGHQLRLRVQMARRDEDLCMARVAWMCSTVCEANEHRRIACVWAWAWAYACRVMVCVMGTRSYAARGGAPWTSITIPRAIAVAAASSRSSASALTQSMRRGLCASNSSTSAALQPRTSTSARLLRPTSRDRLPASSHEAAVACASVSIHTR